MHWIEKAKCRLMDPDLFSPEPEGPNYPPAPTEVAALCAGCLVLENCRRYAGNVANVSGVWGGELWEDGLRKR